MTAALPARTRAGGAPYRVAVVCLGNICRSPMADVVLTDRVEAAGLADRVEVVSAGTGGWHVGGPMDRRAAALLTTHGYDASRHVAQQFGPAGSPRPTWCWRWTPTTTPTSSRRGRTRACGCSATSTPAPRSTTGTCPTRTSGATRGSPRCWPWSSAPPTPWSRRWTRPCARSTPPRWSGRLTWHGWAGSRTGRRRCSGPPSWPPRPSPAATSAPPPGSGCPTAPPR